MPNLVYWYGYGNDNLDEAFSFLDEQRCMTYDEAIANNQHQIPKKVRDKLAAGKKLSSGENKMLCSWSEMANDLKKEPKDRKPFPRIQEDYEMLQSGLMLLAELKDADPISDDTIINILTSLGNDVTFAQQHLLQQLIAEREQTVSASSRTK